jgi:hypothetical protein
MCCFIIYTLLEFIAPTIPYLVTKQPSPYLPYIIAFTVLGGSFVFFVIFGPWITTEGSLVVDLDFIKLVLVGQSCLLVPSSTTRTNSDFTEGSALYRYLTMIFGNPTHTLLSAAVIIVLVGLPTFRAFLIAGNVADNAHC